MLHVPGSTIIRGASTASSHREGARRMNRPVCCGVLALTLASAVHADSWGPPRGEHWSANGKFVLKVGWRDADKQLSLWEKTDDGLQRRWARGYVDRTWPPHRAHVTGDGRHVVLQDVYH